MPDQTDELRAVLRIAREHIEQYRAYSDELARIEMMVASARRVAASALDEREAAIRADLDPVLEVLNAEALQRDLRTAFERCRDNNEPIALLRVPLAGEGGFEGRAKALIGCLGRAGQIGGI